MALVRTDSFLGLFEVYVATDLNLDSFVDGSDYGIMSAGLRFGDVPVPSAFPTSGGIAVCGAGVLAVAGTTAIPVLSPGMLAALSGLLALTAACLRRRR